MSHPVLQYRAGQPHAPDASKHNIMTNLLRALAKCVVPQHAIDVRVTRERSFGGV